MGLGGKGLGSKGLRGFQGLRRGQPFVAAAAQDHDGIDGRRGRRRYKAEKLERHRKPQNEEACRAG